MRRPMIAGNWKMNGLTASADALVGEILSGLAESPSEPCDVVLGPPATLLAEVAERVAGRTVAVAGQDCHTDAEGAHTGDLSAEMIRDAGATHVILGHSERRQDHGERDDLVRGKVLAAYRAGLTAIVCVGETEAERDDSRTIDVIRTQLAGSLPDDASAANTVVAYEPVWAIGTGRTATPAQVAEVHQAIRDALKERYSDGEAFRVLYGGSVKPGNAAELLALDDVDGALVGGASLKSVDFLSIIESCRESII